MNFKDIKRFPHCSYQIDVAWTDLEMSLKRLSEGCGIDLNPVYQRGFKWNIEQKKSYLEYILKGGYSGRDIFWNSANWQGSGEVGVLELVDGQQRLKTVKEFLKNKIAIFDGCFYKDFTGKMRMTDARFKFRINSLNSKLEVVEWYLGLNTGGSIHTEEDLKPAYDFKKKLLVDYIHS